MAKTASQVFTEARKSAFRDAKAFVEKVPETGKVKKKPYGQAYAALRKKYAPVVLGHASGADERVRIGLRLDRMIRDALGAAGITPYVSPVTARTRRMRTDSGVDFQGEPGDPVRAMGKAEVTSSRRVGGFGMLVVYRLLEGPREGQHVYVGHAEPCVKKGDLVKAGAPVATLREHAWGLRRTSPHSRGWVEIGFAAGPLGLPESYKEHDPGVEHDLSTRAGVEFSTFVRRCFGI